MASNFPNGVIIDGRNAGTAIPIRRAVRVATITAGSLATSFESGDTIDGVILATGDRILIKNQVSAVENGIYVVEASGAPFRDVDFEDGASVAGMLIPITGGTQAGSLWNCTNLFGADVVGVNPITFVIAAGSGASGNVSGGGVSTDNAVVRWDGTTGTSVQNSGVILSDANSLSGVVDVGMSGDILDGAGNELINFITTANAVNEISITNAATGTNPVISATGGDTNISLEYLVKGTGVHIFDNPASAAEIRLRDDAGTDYFGIRPAAVTTSYTVTMPAAQGAVDTYLRNDGTGVLSWTTNANGDVVGPASSTDNAIARYDGITGKLIQNSVIILSDTGGLTGVADIGMSGDIRDANGNELINFITTASAVNEISITNAATGTNPIIGVTGGDANISLQYLTKGTGVHIFDNPASAAEIRLLDNVGVDYFGMRPAAATTSYTITMPPSQGGFNTYLQNDGAGNLSWLPNASGDVNGPGASTDNAVVRWDGTSGTFIKNSSVIIDDSGNVSGVNNISMSGDILAGDDNELINFTHVKGAVNEFAVTNALTGENPIIGTTGDDAEISLDYITAGEKSYHYFRAAKAEGEIRLLDTDHKEYIGLRAFKDIKNSYTLIFPNEQGQSGQVLINDGTGQFNWGTFGSGNVSGPGASTDNAIVRWNGGSGTVIQDSGVLLTDTNNITGVVNLGMAGDILDQNNNELINFTSVINAVNEIAISNAITATNPIIAATGGDTNISIEYLSKGTGVHIFDNPASAAEIRLRDLSGTDYFGIRPANATTSYTVTMPATQGAASTYLQNNGAGVLSWATAGNVTGPGSSTDNAIVRWDLATGTLIQNSGVILSDANSVTGLVNVGMIGDILDGAGNELINFTATASAVNEIAITNAATGTNPIIGVSGSDTNISLEYLSKGTGVHIFDNNATAAEIRLRDDVGTDYVGVKAASTTTSYTVTMPAAQGAASTFLQNNGAGILSWVAGSGGSLTYYNTSVAGTTTTSNTAFTLLGGMTLTTPAAGTYMVWFSSSCEKSNNSGSYDFIISIDGGVSAADNSIRTYEPSANSRFQAATTQAVLTVTGVENIQVYFRLTGSGSITCSNRSLVAIRLA